MASLNKVMLIGNLTRDPEVRYTPKGTAVTEIGLAINRYIPATDGGERREETTYVDVTLWGKTAELAGQYLKKGRPVFIEGRLQLESWQDKTTGQNRSKLSVVADGMQFLGGRNEGEGGGGGGGESYGGSSGRSYSGGGGGGGAPRGGDYDSGPSYSSAPSRPAPSHSPGPLPDEGDDIPF
ncbi:MAG: single-stranded DNA-binding protein [Verrucomicrobia bacterium]|nr:single-stranded DNA-binding protein [Verrucomicrobiota bacterium]